MRERVLAFSGNGEELSEYLNNLCSYFGKDAFLEDVKWYIENDSGAFNTTNKLTNRS